MDLIVSVPEYLFLIYINTVFTANNSASVKSPECADMPFNPDLR